LPQVRIAKAQQAPGGPFFLDPPAQITTGGPSLKKDPPKRSRRRIPLTIVSDEPAVHKTERRSKARAERDQSFASSPFRIYRKKRLIELLDIDQSTWWRWRRDGRIPEPDFCQGAIEGWSEKQVAAMFKQRGGGDAQ
jgi:hypothetical protein